MLRYRGSVSTAIFSISLLLPSQFFGALSAQEIPPSLRVIVEEGSDDWRQCGISKDTLVGAAKAALRYNRIEYSDDEFAPYLYVNVNTGSLRTGCASNIDISIERYDTWPKLNGSFFTGNFVYCNTGRLLIGGNHGPRVTQSVRSLVDTCLGKIGTTATPSLNRLTDQYLGDQARQKTPSP